MKAALTIVTDGRREYLDRCLDSLTENVSYAWSQVIVVNDSGLPGHRAWLESTFDRPLFVHHPERRGLAAAVQSAWGMVGDDIEFVFHCEEDFTFNVPVPIDAMGSLLRVVPRVTQLTLKRQPWSREEQAAGGIMEMHPDDYREWHNDHGYWVAHRRLFSLNPSLIPARVVRLGWPTTNEAGFTERLNADPDSTQAYWGRRDDPPIVEHIGYERGAGWKP